MKTGIKVFIMFLLTGIIAAILTTLFINSHFTTEARTFFVSIVVSSSLLSAAMMLILTRNISAPIEEITTGVEEISKGNFDVDIGHDLKNDKSEIGALARAFDRIATSFKLAVDFAGVSKDKLKLGELIEERKKTEQQLLVTKEFLNNIIENVGIPMIAFSNNGEIMMANKKFTEVTGYKKEEAANSDKFISAAFPSKLVSGKFIKAVKQINRGEEVNDFIIPLKCKNGSTIIVMSNLTEIKENDKRKGVAIFMRDLSEIFKLEKEIRFWASNGVEHEKEEAQKQSKIEISESKDTKKKVSL